MTEELAAILNISQQISVHIYFIMSKKIPFKSTHISSEIYICLSP